MERKGLCRAAEWKQRVDGPEVLEAIEGLGAKNCLRLLGGFVLFWHFLWRASARGSSARTIISPDLHQE